MTVSDKYYVYMIECAGGRLYTGITDEPGRRMSEHCTGKYGAKFTRGFKPRAVARCWMISGGRGDALKVEQYIKRKNKVEKLGLVTHPAKLKKDIEQNTGLVFEIRTCSKKLINELNKIIEDENRET